MRQPRFFASDNSSPVHPSVMQALEDANKGHELSYGDDHYTRTAVAELKRVFGADTDIQFVYNGTGANVVGMQSAVRSYHGIICTDVSHIATDECGAPEAITGAKLLSLPSKEGKLQLNTIKPLLEALGVEHHSQPAAVSVTQSTELGTLYTQNELTEISDLAHRHGLLVHMDGARIANAAVALGVSLAEITRDCGVDILSFGATKNGLMFGEAVVFFQPGLATDVRYIRKQDMQLASKMRYIAAQFSAYLADDLWSKNALHANAMAARLSGKVSAIDGVTIVYPVDANAVFAAIPELAIPRLQEEFPFYVWNDAAHVVRWMTSWDTTEEDVDEFASRLAGLLSDPTR